MGVFSEDGIYNINVLWVCSHLNMMNGFFSSPILMGIVYISTGTLIGLKTGLCLLYF